MSIESVSTVLGDSRLVTRTYGDGSVDCPWCSNPIIAPAPNCLNPWCDANPAWEPGKLQARRDEQTRKAEEARRDAATRASVAAAVRERADEHARWQHEQYEEAKRRGACLNCLFAPCAIHQTSGRVPEDGTVTR